MWPSIDRHPVAAFVAITFGFTWGIQIPVALSTSEPSVQFAAVAVSTFGPLVAATVLVWRSETSLRAWFRDALSWRVAPRWYLAAFGVPLAGVAAYTAYHAAFVGELEPSLLPRRLLMWAGVFPVALLVTGGNEEFGWRGYMLPQLQQSHGALAASLVIGVVWMVWHLPSDFLMTAVGGGTSWSMGRIALRLATIPLAVVLTWLYNSTDGSVLLAMLFHACWNTMGVLVPAPFPSESAGPVTAEAGAVVQLVRVGVMVAIALAILVVYRWGTLSASERYTGPRRS